MTFFHSVERRAHDRGTILRAHEFFTTQRPHAPCNVILYKISPHETFDLNSINFMLIFIPHAPFNVKLQEISRSLRAEGPFAHAGS